MEHPNSKTLHATAVAVEGRGVMLIGKSGTGKSSLALEMMARGANLVADDQVTLVSNKTEIQLHCPAALFGMIEARGMGILRAEAISPVALSLVVDMDQEEKDRMPPERSITFFTQSIPLLHKVASLHFPAALIQYLRWAGRDSFLVR